MNKKEYKNEKRRLERKEDRLSRALEIFTALVVIGLIAEYAPDIVEAFKTWTFSPRLIGPILITLGVAGELVVEFWSSIVGTKLREVNDSIISDTTKRAEKAETEITELRTPRTLPEAERAELVEALKPYAGRSIDVVMFEPHDREVRPFAESLHDAFSRAGWESQLSWLTGGFRMYGRAVTIGIANNATPADKLELNSIAEVVASVLNKCGIKSTIAFGFSTDEKLTAIASPEWTVKDVALFRIQIGQKAVFDDVF